MADVQRDPDAERKVSMRISRLMSERGRVDRMARTGDRDTTDRVAEIDAELDELGVRRTAPPEGEPHGPGM